MKYVGVIAPILAFLCAAASLMLGILSDRQTLSAAEELSRKEIATQTGTPLESLQASCHHTHGNGTFSSCLVVGAPHPAILYCWTEQEGAGGAPAGVCVLQSKL